MSRPRSIWIAIAAVALSGCFNAPPEETAAESPRPSPGITLEGAALTETRDGEKIWDLKAEQASYRTAPQLAELTGVTTRFYEDGAIVSTGTAPRATFHLGDRKLELVGGIEVRGEGGQSGFSAEAVTVMPDSGQLTAEGEVTFFRGANRMRGARLEASRSLKRVALDGGVTGRFSLGAEADGPAIGTPVAPPPSQGI